MTFSTDTSLCLTGKLESRKLTLTSWSKEPVTNSPVSTGYHKTPETLYLCAPRAPLPTLNIALCVCNAGATWRRAEVPPACGVGSCRAEVSCKHDHNVFCLLLHGGTNDHLHVIRRNGPIRAAGKEIAMVDVVKVQPQHPARVRALYCLAAAERKLEVPAHAYIVHVLAALRMHRPLLPNAAPDKYLLCRSRARKWLSC